MEDPIHFKNISKRIYIIRGHRVMIDRDLADLYQVETKVLNQAVRRNSERFPEDFMFELNAEEDANLRSQIVTSSLGRGHGGRRYGTLVFTEQGVAMLSSVLRSDRAIHVNIAIIRAFVHLRELIDHHKDLSKKLAELERRYDSQFKAVFDAIRELMSAGSTPRKKIRGLRS